MNRFYRGLRLLAALSLLSCASLLGPTTESVAQANFCSNALYSATTGEAITASDTTVYTPPARAVYVGGVGDVKVRMAASGGSTSLTFTAVPAGTLLPICIDMVYSTGTTATAMVILR